MTVPQKNARAAWGALLVVVLCCCAIIPSVAAGASAPGKLEGLLVRGVEVPYPRSQSAKTEESSFALETTHGAVKLAGNEPDGFDSQLVVAEHTTPTGDGLRAQLHLVHPEQHLAASPPPGPQTVLAILITTPDDGTPAAASAEAARRAIFTEPYSAGAFYADQSGGTTTLAGRVDPRGDVIGPIGLSTSMAGCPTETLANEADARATALGYSPSSYDHVLYILPNSPECPWGGWAYISGRRSWSNGYLDTSVIAHELGHNMGAAHANLLDCTDEVGNPVSYSSACESIEYGDPFDVMGFSTALMGAFHRLQIGELPLDHVDKMRESGTVELVSSEDFASPGIRLALIPIKHPHLAVTDYFAVDTRSPLAPFDPWGSISPVSTGLTIRKVTELPYIQTQLLKMHPSGEAQDSPLQPGETFTDAADNIAISADISTSGDLEASVTMPPLPATDDVPPTPPVLLYGYGTPEGVHLGWLSGTDDVEVSHYRILRDNVDIGTTTEPSFDDPTARTLSQATYSVITVDTSDNESAPATTEVTIPHFPAVSPPVISAVIGQTIPHFTPAQPIAGSLVQEASGAEPFHAGSRGGVVISGHLRRDRHRHILVTLRCAATSTCTGELHLFTKGRAHRHSIGRTGYTISAGTTTEIAVPGDIPRSSGASILVSATPRRGRPIQRTCHLSQARRARD